MIKIPQNTTHTLKSNKKRYIIKYTSKASSILSKNNTKVYRIPLGFFFEIDWLSVIKAVVEIFCLVET
jgi:hypothetical protein